MPHSPPGPPPGFEPHPHVPPLDDTPDSPAAGLDCRWYHRINPCDICRHPALAPLGDVVAKLATDCPCCNGWRMIGTALVSAAITLIATLWLT